MSWRRCISPSRANRRYMANALSVRARTDWASKNARIYARRPASDRFTAKGDVARGPCLARGAFAGIVGELGAPIMPLPSSHARRELYRPRSPRILLAPGGFTQFACSSCAMCQRRFAILPGRAEAIKEVSPTETCPDSRGISAVGG